MQVTERSVSDSPSAEAIRDQWEAELELESPATTQTSEETLLATLMQEAPIPIISSPPERTWIWSDLHLADRSVLAASNRPFRSIEEMNRHLLREWSRRVHANDTIICLGDVAHPDAWGNRRLLLDLRNCPGERILVLGNHDLNTQALHDAGFGTMCIAALCDTDPPLALSHLPLRRVPPTAINVHGHIHGGEAPTRRHFNVSVERTDYAPVGLNWVLERARCSLVHDT